MIYEILAVNPFGREIFIGTEDADDGAEALAQRARACRVVVHRLLWPNQRDEARARIAHPGSDEREEWRARERLAS